MKTTIVLTRNEFEFIETNYILPSMKDITTGIIYDYTHYENLNQDITGVTRAIIKVGPYQPYIPRISFE